MSESLLSSRDLSITFHTENGVANAVDGISFDVKKNQKVGIVGESGCGKSIVCRSLLQLLPKYAEVSGEALYKGANVLSMKRNEIYHIRGAEISMIFQEPMVSLNPLYTIGNQLSETIRIHQKVSRKEAMEKAEKMLELVKIPSPKERLKQYPFEMSGGMRQRVMIAIALACNPRILIADEPTTALDVTIQAQILELINELNRELGTSLILITHDLGVIAETVDMVIVMYAGHVMEQSSVEDIFANPLHPYTKGLLASMPKMDVAGERLSTIPGTVPSIFEMPKGCRFQNRCASCTEKCKEKAPPTFDVNGHKVKCWLYEGK